MEYGINGKTKLQVEQFEQLDLKDKEYQSLEVSYYRSQESKPTRIMINDVEGRVLKIEDSLEYAVYYNNLFITLTVDNDNITPEMFADIVTQISK